MLGYSDSNSGVSFSMSTMFEFDTTATRTIALPFAVVDALWLDPPQPATTPAAAAANAIALPMRTPDRGFRKNTAPPLSWMRSYEHPPARLRTTYAATGRKSN